MRNNSSVICVFALSIVLFAVVTVSATAASVYNISGDVVDINGNGVPGAKISMFQEGLIVGSPVYTDDYGHYVIELSMLSSGNYQIVSEKDGKQSSALFKFSSGGSKNITVKTIAMTSIVVSPKPKPSATAVPTAVSTPTPTAAPTVTATAVPTAEATATPTATATPVPTPGFALIPALLALCVIALKKKV